MGCGGHGGSHKGAKKASKKKSAKKACKVSLKKDNTTFAAFIHDPRKKKK
jgi:hypothetical protein